MSQTEQLVCIECGASYDIDKVRYRCECHGLLEVQRPIEHLKGLSTDLFDQRKMSEKDVDVSGVWRFREAVLAGTEPVTHPEGGTKLYSRESLNKHSGIDNFYLKHEGENPSGSFKDRGMTTAVSQAKSLGAEVVACASTGNTSASLAMYAAQAGLKSVVFLPAGKVASGKLAQAIAYGAKCLGIEGDFDDAMSIVQKLAAEGKVYMVNSLNPFRLEGQKTIIWEILQNLSWQAPDWIVVPGGNLGNTSAFGKAIHEAYEAGWINKKPRLATIQAAGANPFYTSFKSQFENLDPIKAETVATAIRIGNPVNFPKAKRVIDKLNGVVCEVNDTEILEAKAFIDGTGIGCEPASACSLAGAKKLVAEGVIKKTDTVVGILTGNVLKDPECIIENTSNEIQNVSANYDDILRSMGH